MAATCPAFAGDNKDEYRIESPAAIEVATNCTNGTNEMHACGIFLAATCPAFAGDEKDEYRIESPVAIEVATNDTNGTNNTIESTFTM